MAGTNNKSNGSINSNSNKQTRGSASGGNAKTGNTKTKAQAGRKVSGNTRSSGDGSNSTRYDDTYTKERKEAAKRALLEEGNSRKDEIMLFVYLAIAIFLFVSNFGLCGFIGDAISGFIFGMVGSVGYILPVYLFVAAAYLLVNGAHRKVLKRIECITLFIVAIAFVCQLASGASGVGIKTLFTEGSKHKDGGGVLLGGILVLLYKLIGLPGSVIVIALLVIIGIIVVMDVSLIDIFKGGFEKRRRIMNTPDYDDSYMYEENPNKDKNVLGSIEVLDSETSKKEENKKGKKEHKNSVVKEEEVHELKPIKQPDSVDSSRLTVNKDTPLDYFNINSYRTDEGMYGNDAGDYQRDNTAYNTNPNSEFFEKTAFADNEMYAGQFADSAAQSDEYIGSADNTYKDNYYSGNGQYADSQVNNYNNQYAYEQDSNYSSQYADSQTNNYNNQYADNQGYADNMQYSDNITELYSQPEQAMDKGSLTAEQEVSDINDKKSGHSKTKKASAEATDVRSESSAADNVSPASAKTDIKKPKEYRLPSTNLLLPVKGGMGKNNERELQETARLLEMTLANFGVNVTVTEHTCGPAVTRYELQPEMGVKVSKIVSLADDIKLNLAASDIRIEAPIPGKPAVGIEVPNKEKKPVSFRELIESDTFKRFPSKIPFAVGKDIGGQVIVTDIAKMPHLMVAGSTGSGKSVCINSLIVSILYKAKPDEVKLIMVDPKKVEFSVYNGIPHLLIPVVTDPKKAAGALNWAVVEMTNRYQLFAQYNVRNLQGYNEKVKAVTGSEDGDEELKKLPQIVIIIDELADLMMVAHGEVEDAIVRLAQLARAAGIHMIIATQRPSADVITGLIKANVPSRIAMKVSNGMESRIIIDQVGAEKLLGNGDMMFYPTGYQKPVRVQGAFLSDGEIERIVDFIKSQQEDVVYDENVEAEITNASSAGTTSAGAGEPAVDDYFADAGRFIIGKDKASIGMLQRVYKIGFNRAARIMDQLSDAGVVGPEEGTKPRKVLMSLEEFENYCEEHL